jgi:hypothetical protein
MTGVNVLTAVLGLIGVLPVVRLESYLLFGWGSDRSHHPLLWYTASILYRFAIPWTVWFLVIKFRGGWNFGSLTGENPVSLQTKRLFECPYEMRIVGVVYGTCAGDFQTSIHTPESNVP